MVQYMIQVNSNIVTINSNRLGYILDVDASKVIEAIRSSGVTITPAMRDYAHVICSGLKNSGVWSKCNAIYGFLGGTAASHKWNWKDLRDLDAAFRLSFLGSGWVHSATGSTPNGTTSYASTFLTPSVTLTANSTHLSMYSPVDILSGSYEISSNNSSSQTLSLLINYSGSVYSDQYNQSSGRVSAPNSSSKGYFVASRLSATSHSIFKNGAKLDATSTSGGSLPTNAILLASTYNGPTPGYLPSKRTFAFASIGSGLSDTEVSQMNSIVAFAQSILNRK